MFNEERTKMEAKYKETTSLLRRAMEDVIFLSAQNEELEVSKRKSTQATHGSVMLILLSCMTIDTTTACQDLGTYHVVGLTSGEAYMGER